MVRSRRVSCILGFPRSRWGVASSIVVTGDREVIGGMVGIVPREVIGGMVVRGDMIGIGPTEVIVGARVMEGVTGK